MRSPAFKRSAISWAVSRTAVRRSRSTNSERWSLASQPKNGQSATSRLAMKCSGANVLMTMMSSHEMWFEISSVGRSREIAPVAVTRTPRSQQITR